MLEIKSGLEKNTEKQSGVVNLPVWKVILKPRAAVATQIQFEKDISLDSECSRQRRYPTEQLRLFRHFPVNSGSFKLSGYQRFRYLDFMGKLQLFSV
ncbi:MAG: hypothetical protein N3E45_11585 [Oscillatoriaceae bacterium SKW80]|nr:hypothetical protein [Oscillatoriaceae bacterium SKYG93]MCX8121445.1 hypothetical protein [Oscillatoriaceae bacterium SKW80]MDW8455145.1 hypothetical protein [Oscillatoriaceae cyanobacterium SKYGB_i_bin93]HIK26456.1 hypothetical protein [Oscillatoriaceae cyanobacterium M7585_C2015_266]